ncbi:MAG TPA: ferritin-like domain-containing protein [Thermoanaerobacterales bacterium]|nr:ferritin-like domain-containing protein [Thermoanaerobacterales bacterium]
MLEEKKLVQILNWFYGLELEQVDLYTAQSNQVEDIYLKKALRRIAVIEQQHADNMGAELKRLGHNPSVVGDIFGPVIGRVMGSVVGYAGPIAILRTDIAVEEKAMRDYKDFILKAGCDERLFDLLWSNLLDEDFHTAWFANKLREYEKLEVK